MIGIALRFLGATGILGWAKLIAIVGVVSSALYMVNDYKRLSAKTERQAAEIVRLDNNVKSYKLLLAGTTDTLGELDEECKAAAERFIRDSDIMKRIDKAADPLTDAANYDPSTPED